MSSSKSFEIGIIQQNLITRIMIIQEQPEIQLTEERRYRAFCDFFEVLCSGGNYDWEQVFSSKHQVSRFYSKKDQEEIIAQSQITRKILQEKFPEEILEQYDLAENKFFTKYQISLKNPIETRTQGTDIVPPPSSHSTAHLLATLQPTCLKKKSRLMNLKKLLKRTIKHIQKIKCSLFLTFSIGALRRKKKNIKTYLL